MSKSNLSVSGRGRRPAATPARWLLLFGMILVVTSVLPANYEIPLQTGWNLISLPEQQTDPRVEIVTTSIAGQFSSIWTCDAGGWQVYYPDEPGFSNLRFMDAGTAYWVDMKVSGTLVGAGMKPASTIALANGWNYVGYNSSTPRPVSEWVQSAGDAVVSVWTLVNGQWRSWAADSPGALQMAQPGQGYIMDCSSPAYLTIFSAGELFTTDPILGNLMYVPAGTFTQGRGPGDPCSWFGETPFTHTLTKDLAVMETEVTQGMWDALQAADPSGFPPANPSYWKGGSLPVERVTWNDAVLFANRLSVLRGLTLCYYTDPAKTTAINASNYYGNNTIYCDFGASGYRLPTEGEWEHACRAGTTTPFSVAEHNFTSCDSYCSTGALPGLESVAWFCANSGRQTHPVGQKNANPWGLKDMHGNVMEWCWDWYSSSYPTGSATDHAGPGSITNRVIRGGSCVHYATGCRSAYRSNFWPGYRDYDFGFRLLRTVDTTAVCEPQITNQPLDRTITSGQTAIMTVTATGTAPLHYAWYQGERGDTTTPAPGGTDAPSYTTPALTATTRYWAQVSNACGVLGSRTATVAVGGNGGDVYATDPIVGDLMYVPAGTFTQGRGPGDPCGWSDETPFTHTLTKNLAVMETEVSQGMWAALQAADPSGFPPANPSNWKGSNLPVEQVTWYEAVLFANRLSALRGLNLCYYTDASKSTVINASNYNNNDTIYCDFGASGYRLPREGEWERACRAGTTTPLSVAEPNFTSCDYYCSTGAFLGLESVAWFCANAEDKTHPVGQKNANPWGLKDIHGNVKEWCWDWIGTYPSGSATDYAGPGSGEDRAIRGGGWGSDARICRSACRDFRWPYSRYLSWGFRLLRSVN